MPCNDPVIVPVTRILPLISDIDAVVSVADGLVKLVPIRTVPDNVLTDDILH